MLAILIVLAAYAFYASGGTMRFPSLSDSGESRYADLAAGFVRGHLYMAHDPDPRLAALPNPWDEQARQGIWYLWDVSYYNGRYYLYFSPLPAVVFYLPYRALFGRYPTDELATLFFSAWAFLAAVLFVHRARAQRGIPFAFWVLLIGFGNVIPWVLVEPHVYEVSVTFGMAMTAMWALALLAFANSPTARRAAHGSLWLGLAIAARPNLGMLLFVTAIGVVMETRAVRVLIAFVAPLAVVGTAMIVYNVVRFSEPFEFGVRYQLTHVSMFEKHVCGVSSFAELGRLINHALQYTFSAPVIGSRFPFVDLPHANLDQALVWPSPHGSTEAVAGLAPLVPLTIIGTFLALLLLGLDRGQRDAGTRVALQVIAGGWLVLIGLSSCWWVVARYALDFMLLIVIASIVCIEAGTAPLERLGIRILPLRVVIVALACFSIVAGLLLGFAGPGSAFERVHPEMFHKVSGIFHR